jgi:hypothetical protein
MANRIRKLTATTPAGIFTRRTDHDYTHVVVHGSGDTAHATWHGNLVNARRQVTKSTRWGGTVTIHEVDGADVTAAMKGAI